MLRIDGRFYQILTLIVWVSGLYLICLLLAIPLVTLPAVVLIYCRFMSNIVAERKLLYFNKITGSRILQYAGNIGMGYCVMYSILILYPMGDFFLSRLVMAFLISFQVIASILLVEYESKFMVSMKTAFFYSAANFHKSVLPVFLCIQGLKYVNGLVPVYAVIVTAAISSFFVFRMNYDTLETLAFLKKR